MEKNKGKEFKNSGFAEVSRKRAYSASGDQVHYQTESDWTKARAMELALLESMKGPDASAKASKEWLLTIPPDRMQTWAL